MPCSKCHTQTFYREPEVLFFDTENSPNEGRYYGSKYETRINKVTKPWEFLMFSYALGDGKVQVVQSWNERELVQKMQQLIDQADIVIAHNLNFDMGHFYMKCIKYGIPVPREPKRVCTLKMYRKLCKGGFESNSLKDIAHALGLPEKKELPRGFWDDYIDQRTDKLVRQAKFYAKGDIVTLRAIYYAIAPFFPPYKIKQFKS